MPVTLSNVIYRVRSDLDEPAYPTFPGSVPNPLSSPQPRFYTDTEITEWVNDALRDISRRAEDLITYDTTIAIPAYGENPALPAPTYPLPTDVLRINRVEFQVGNDSSQVYPLEASTQSYLDNIWNIDQLSTMSYPAYWCTRGYPGGVGRNLFVIQLFPNPAQFGQLNLFYYRLPTRFPDPVINPAAYTQPVDVIEGWDDMIVDFAVMRALIKARNPDWQILQQIYEQKMTNVIDTTRRFHDQAQHLTYDTMIMPWAYDSWGGF